MTQFKIKNDSHHRRVTKEIADVQVAIIGAGFSGIAMAAGLRKSHRDSFIILEKESELGGCWRDNNYPGAECDSPAHIYSIGGCPNPHWENYTSSRDDIKAYMGRLFEQFELGEQTLFNAKVVRLRYSETYHYWLINLSNGMEIRAQIVVMGSGVLNKPSFGGLEDRHHFAGEYFHSSQWPKKIDFHGKKVGVIGTGASAAQIIPQIAPHVEHLSCFMRTAPWVLPRKTKKYSKTRQMIFENWPFMLDLHRKRLEVGQFWQSNLFVSNSALINLLQNSATRHLKNQIGDSQLIEQLTPDHRLGCKRVIRSNDFYPALARENVELISESILAVHSAGIETTRQKLVELDLMIFATGFKTQDRLLGLDIVGRAGRSLTKEWKHDTNSFMGIMVSGYPSLFWLLGPNTYLSHRSVLPMIDAQVAFILRCLREMDMNKAIAIEVKAVAQQKCMFEIKNKIASTVWASGCDSWYIDPNSQANPILWPGHLGVYRQELKKFRAHDFGLVMA